MSLTWRGIQDLRLTPRFFLHPAHVMAGNRLRPLDPEAVLEILAEAGQDQALMDTEEPTHADVESMVQARLEGSKFVLRSPGDSTEGGVMGTIPLLLTEVRLCSEITTGWPLIMVANAMGGSLWLVVVSGNTAAGWHALNLMNEVGAIRSDFHEHYAMSKKALGYGSRAAVFKVLPKSVPAGGAHVVAKVPMPAKSLDANVNEGMLPRDVQQEVEMLAAVGRHPNIVHLRGLFHLDEQTADHSKLHSPRWILALGDCDCGDLFESARRCTFSEVRAMQVINSVLLALQHVHQRGIVHRDVKPENILLTSDGRVVLADFGVACFYSDVQQMKRRCGSPGYIAPEILRGHEYDFKVDCFSTGCLLFFILSYHLAFEAPDADSMMLRTQKGDVDFGVSSLFKSVSELCKNFILTLLLQNVDERPSAAVAIDHAWFSAMQERPNSKNSLASEESIYGPYGVARSASRRSTRQPEQTWAQASKESGNGAARVSQSASPHVTRHPEQAFTQVAPSTSSGLHFQTELDTPNSSCRTSIWCEGTRPRSRDREQAGTTIEPAQMSQQQADAVMESAGLVPVHHNRLQQRLCSLTSRHRTGRERMFTAFTRIPPVTPSRSESVGSRSPRQFGLRSRLGSLAQQVRDKIVASSQAADGVNDERGLHVEPNCWAPVVAGDQISDCSAPGRNKAELQPRPPSTCSARRPGKSRWASA